MLTLFNEIYYEIYVDFERYIGFKHCIYRSLCFELFNYWVDFAQTFTNEWPLCVKDRKTSVLAAENLSRIYSGLKYPNHF